MALRDVSPAQWASPGVARVSLNLILTAHGFDPAPFDIWLSNYSPDNDQTVNLTNGFQALTNPDTTNCRIFILVLPRGNTTSVTLKGVTGDTGLGVNPNGMIFFTPVSAIASIGVTTGGAITGARVIWA